MNTKVEQTANEDAIDKIRRQINTQADQRVAAADAARTEAEKKAAEAVAGRFASDRAAITNGIAAATGAVEAHKAALAAAGEKGDWKALADAQAALNEAQISLTTFNNRKARLETQERIETDKARQAAERGDQHQAPQRVDYSPTTQAWLDKNNIDGQPNAQGQYSPEFVRAFAAHNAAVNVRGLKGDTPEYFAYMEEQLGIGGNDNNVEAREVDLTSTSLGTVEVDLSDKDGRIVRQDPPVQTQQSRPAPVLSPVRTVPGNDGINGSRVRLSAAEVEAARVSNPEGYAKDPAAVLRQYAKDKADLVAEGAYHRYG